MSSESFDLFERMAQTESGRRILDMAEDAAIEREGGFKRSQRWACEDGWLVEYTTTPMIGGPHDGKFVVASYKPVGKGSRGGRGKARSWKRHYMRAFAKRKTARARAEALYFRHSPKHAAKYGKGRRSDA